MKYRLIHGIMHHCFFGHKGNAHILLKVFAFEVLDFIFIRKSVIIKELISD